MKKSKLQIVAAFMTWTSVVCLPGCSEPGSSRGNDQLTIWVTIDCEYPGASSEEVASLVSYPIETTLTTIPGVENVSSVSRSGRATIWVKFEPDTDLFEARQAVAKRLKVAASSLPDGAIPTLLPPSSDEVLLIALYAQTVPDAAEPRIELEGRLRDLAEYSLRPRLLTISGVSGVTMTGGSCKRYEVVASRERLRALNIIVTDLVSAIEKANEAVATDDLIKSKDVLARNAGQIRNVEDLTNTVVVTQGDRTVRVKDVAEVHIGWVNKDDWEDGVKENREPKRFGGVVLAIQLTPNADKQAVSKKIDEILKQLRGDLPSGIKTARRIDNRFAELVKLTMQKLGQKRPPGWEYQRRSTYQCGDHLVAGKSDRAVIKLIGPDLKVLRRKADEVLSRLREVPGMTGLRVDPPADIPQLKVELDREASERFGLTSASLAEALSTVVFGKVVAQIREGKQLIDVFVKAHHSGDDQADIGRHLIRTERGDLVPVDQLAKLKVEAVPPVVYSENHQPFVFVSFRVQGREKPAVAADIEKALEQLKQSLERVEGGYRIEYLSR